MILQVLVTFDKKARAFMMPIYVAHVDVAVRVVAQCANEPEHQLCKFAEDFALYHLGTFNDENAEFTLYPQPKHICEVLNLKKATSV